MNSDKYSFLTLIRELNVPKLISDCGELEAEAYEYFHRHKYEIEKSEIDFIAKLT